MDDFVDIVDDDHTPPHSNPFNADHLLHAAPWLDTPHGSPFQDSQLVLDDDYMGQFPQNEVSVAGATMANSSTATAPHQLTLTSFHTLVHRRSPFSVAVHDPHKSPDGARDPHVTYLIHTHDLVNSAEFHVRRRFTDFVWLHDTLVLEFPHVIVCPLPGKHRLEYLTGDRFSSDFVDRRRGSLHRFLSRITKHPHLQKSNHLRTFLTESNWNLAQMKSLTVSQYGDKMSPSTMDTLLPLMSQKPKSVNAKFQSIKDATDLLETQLSTIEKIQSRLVKRHIDLEHDVMDLGLGITKLGALEGNTKMAVVEHALTHVGGIWMEVAKVRAAATRHDDVDVAAHVRDCLLMCGSVKLALKRRDDIQAEYEHAKHALSLHQTELARYHSEPVPANAMASVGHFIKDKYDVIKGVDLDKARSDRIARLDAKVARLADACDAARSADELFSVDVAREVDYANAARAVDFRELMSEVVNGHVEFFEKSAKLWESMIVALEEMDINVD